MRAVEPVLDDEEGAEAAAEALAAEADLCDARAAETELCDALIEAELAEARDTWESEAAAAFELELAAARAEEEATAARELDRMVAELTVLVFAAASAGALVMTECSVVVAEEGLRRGVFLGLTTRLPSAPLPRNP